VVAEGLEGQRQAAAAVRRPAAARELRAVAEAGAAARWGAVLGLEVAGRQPRF
jgi:hypothetical protein